MSNYKHEKLCRKCGNDKFYWIDNNDPVIVLVCTKCDEKHDVLVCTCGDDD